MLKYIGNEINKIILDIQAAEGGDDSKLLVTEHLKSYVNRCNKNYL